MYPDWTVMYSENFLDLLDKAQDILESWQNRNQTLMGKITVVNSLVNSLFTHKLLSLPTPPDSFFQIYRIMISKYLWDDKPPRIAYD